MKRNILITLLVVLLVLVGGCTKDNPEKFGKDAAKFKEDYEALNGKETGREGVVYRTITIDEKNPIEYITFKDVSEKINNKESFVVYVGFSACPWCRSVVPYALEVAKENNIDTIYYVNVRSDNTKASDLRGYYKLDKNNKAVVDIEADPYYHTVLNTLDKFLTPYTLETSKGKVVETGENRLYAPSFIVYKDGVAVGLDECISDKQTDGFMDLTDEMIKDMKDKANNLFKKFNS